MYVCMYPFVNIYIYIKINIYIYICVYMSDMYIYFSKHHIHMYI